MVKKRRPSRTRLLPPAQRAGRPIHLDVTPERKQHGIVIQEKTAEGKRSRVLTQAPLDFYLHRFLITSREHEAGDLYWRDYQVAGFMRPIVPSFESIVMGQVTSGSSFLCGSERQQHAMQRWRKATDSISGTIGKTLVLNVCCWGYHLKEILQADGRMAFGHYNHANVMPRLREALTELADHYGLPRTDDE